MNLVGWAAFLQETLAETLQAFPLQLLGSTRIPWISIPLISLEIQNDVLIPVHVTGFAPPSLALLG